MEHNCLIRVSTEKRVHNKNIFLGFKHLAPFTILNKTRRKVLKVAKMKDANYGCKDEGNDDGVSGLMTD